jgi:integrase/recombinase XerC
MQNEIAYTQTRGLSLVKAAELFVRNQTSVRTQEAYTFDIKQWFTWYPSETVPTLDDAISFREFLTEKYASRSAARIFNTIRSFYRFLGGQNPFQSIKSPSRVKNATPDVPDDLLVIKMLDLVDNDKDRLILTLLLNGLRRTEVIDLKGDSIKYSGTYGVDIIKVIGKGNKERLVPANMETSKAWRSYSPQGNFDGWLFQMYDHPDMEDHIKGRAVEYICEKWSRKAGKKVSPHKLRHHYATRMVRAKVDVFNLAKLMGHTSVATTQVYVALDLDDAVTAAAKDPLNLVLER